MQIVKPYRIFALGFNFAVGISSLIELQMGEILKNRLKQQKFRSIEQEGLLNLFIASNYLHSKLDSICNRYQITIGQFNVLRILKGTHPEGYPRGEIIQRMVEPAPDVTRLTDRLVKEDFVERYNSKDDRRLSLARITKKGSTISQRSILKWINLFWNILQH